MSKRGDVELLKDILESANRIQRYVGTFTLAEFMADTQAQDAVVRNLSIIGEAVKNPSAEFREQHQEVEWAKIAGLRDKLKAEAKKDVNRILRADRRVVHEALKRGVRKAMLRHKREGLPVVVERDGKIEWVKPEDLGF